MPARPPRWLVLLSFGLLLALSTLCLGCKNHLVGLHDVVLHLTVEDAPMAEDELAARIGRRLAAADISADVDTGHPGEVDVRVDEDFADEASRALTWQGGLLIAQEDRADPTGFARPAIAELDTADATASGTRLIVPLSAESEAAILHARDGKGSSARFVVVRDDAILDAVLDARDLVQGHRLVVPLGTSIVAYTRAADLARLLTGPRLPRLTRTSMIPVPADWVLAAANLVLPFAVSFAWLFFVRRFDRAQPEPMWLVVLTFGLGAVAVIPAGLVEWGLDVLSPWTNPTYLTFGRSMRAFPIALVGFIVTVGVTEEGAKLLATWSVAIQRREFDEPVDGMVYAAAAALGFAAAENLRYLALGRVAGPLVASRAFMSVPAHLFFSTVWGFALGQRLVHPKKPVWPFFLGAVTLHGLFDTCLSIDGGGWWAIPVALLVASIFILHLQRALRHGAIDPSSAVPVHARGEAELFRMGSRRAFLGFAASVYLFAALIFLITLLGRAGHDRVSLATIVASATALALLGWAARGVASTLPLDVVIDDAGVTFAGAEILYRDVVRIERRRLLGSPRRREQLVVLGESRRLILGPASGETIDALSHALAMKLSSVALRS